MTAIDPYLVLSGYLGDAMFVAVLLAWPAAAAAIVEYNLLGTARLALATGVLLVAGAAAYVAIGVVMAIPLLGATSAAPRTVALTLLISQLLNHGVTGACFGALPSAVAGTIAWRQGR